MELFWCRGYDATSLQDLLEATGLSKSSLYESFGNKQSIFESAFTRYFEGRARFMRKRLDESESAVDFIRECLMSVLEDASRDFPRGCMLVNVANEFSSSDPAIHHLVILASKRFRRVFELAFERAQQNGEIPADKTPAELALLMHCIMNGLRTQTKSGLSHQELITVIDLVMLRWA
ncbi:TetR/AcrR family transcriptional regulator [Pseudomonas sp. TNT2022 ID1044]|uniref:TetR/AcrR family transcriptional regulator n=1 Tax=Pseudomonas sp. TNT2022 ID1044 TaxID=2942636 RepID=UPI002360D424|nr:TetR/AcrR family transcriptional regulator [Pseudomonas sp. TNT2022 ID1044]MDD0997556.1 TetR/AcrR family transcriptional regulator [Pseudomonas sp. TNT2022 ID1044]